MQARIVRDREKNTLVKAADKGEIIRCAVSKSEKR
jgi:hypothetical protein